MKDIKNILAKKYFQLLKAELDIPVFIDYVPNQLAADAYVLITGISSVDASTFSSSDTDTTIQAGIYTKDTVINTGTIAEDTAEIVFQTIYPSQDSLLDLGEDFGKCSIQLVNDVSPDVIQTDSDIFINRIITFRHSQITHN